MAKLFVVGIPRDMEAAELEEIFSDYGAVNSATVITDIETGRSKGYAFVMMAEQAAAESAIAALNGGQIDERTISVRFADQGGQQEPRQFKRPEGVRFGSGLKDQTSSAGSRRGKRPRKAF